MSSFNQWTVSPNNHGRSCTATALGGLPQGEFLWQSLKCAKYGAGWEYCADESRIYINSAEELAVALDVSTGEHIWEEVFPKESTSSIAISNNKVCIPPYILSMETGEILEDLTTYGYSFRFVEDVQNDIFVITTDGDNAGVLFYQDAGHEFFSIDIYAVSSIEGGRGIVGFDNKSLLCYSTASGKIRWSIECPSGKNGNILVPSSSGYMVIDNLIYLHTNYDTLSCINPQTGNVLWQSGPSLINEDEPPLYRMSPSRFLGCNDSLYLGRNIADDGFIQARNITDGSEQWRINAPQARIFLIAGDLLFGSLSDVPVAWDRYTGEVVWKADKPMTAIFHAVAAENKIIYTNTMSQMRCYEWTEPYHSPAKA